MNLKDSHWMEEGYVFDGTLGQEVVLIHNAWEDFPRQWEKMFLQSLK